jgi:REP element-mobilizing transposase RayT
MQHVLILGCADVCANRGWRLHAVATEPSHVHLIVSWKQFIPWQEVRQRIKNVLSYLLGRVMSQNGRQWFVREGSRKRVLDREHFDHLIRQYFPRHRGLSWREGEALPEDRWGILGARRSKTRGLPSAAMKDGRDESRRQQIQ